MNRQAIIKSVILLLLSSVYYNNSLIAQGEIVSVNPPSAFQGETVHLIIQGSETDFKEGETDVYFPEFINVESVLVSNPELMTVRIRITDEAPEGICEFNINTNTQQYKAEFEIIKLAGEPEAMITVFPVQSVYLSDFDFSNLHNLPLLFTISVYSADHNYLLVYAELSHEKYGIVTSADKELENPGFIVTFDNRQFDNYDKDKASDEIIESAIGNGIIPPGLYTYIVSLFDENNKPLGDPVTSDFYISESVSGIDMIAPGTSLDSDPEVIYTNTPYFQWFGGLAEYNFTLYEVLEGQRSADDITTNIPVFEMTGLTSASYLYPNFAESLLEGKRYAWQITSGILTGSGTKEIRSEVYWFIYQRSNKTGRYLDKIKVYPDDINLMPGDSVRIKADGFDINGDTLKVECEWQVIPADGGTVNEKGWFIAGNKPGTVAVSAICSSKQDYITINIIKRE